MSDRTLTYKPGTWFGIVGEHATVLLPASEKSRAGTLWAMVDDGAGFDAVLDALVSAGLSKLPGFVLLSGSGDSTRVLIRGEAAATFESPDGQVSVQGSASTMWVDQTIDGATSFAIVLPGEPADGADFTVTSGLVRVASIATPHSPRLAPVVSLSPAGHPVDPIHDPITESYSGLFATTDPAAPVDEPHEPELQESQQPDEPADDPIIPAAVIEPARTEQPDPEPQDEHDGPEESASMLDHFWPEDESPAASPPAGLPTMPPPPPVGLPSVPPPPPLPPVGLPPAGLPPVPTGPPPSYSPNPDEVETGNLGAIGDVPTEAIPIDHDGMTRAGLPDIPPPPHGIPGQPAAPSVTAYAVAHLSFSSGEDIDVDRVIVIGRAPEAGRFSAEDQPLLVTVPSPHQEISSTHVEVRPGTGVDHGAAVVTDLGSTNGTLVVQPGLGPEELRPGVPVQLMPGALIDLGDGLTIRVSHP